MPEKCHHFFLATSPLKKKCKKIKKYHGVVPWGRMYPMVPMQTATHPIKKEALT